MVTAVVTLVVCADCSLFANWCYLLFGVMCAALFIVDYAYWLPGIYGMCLVLCVFLLISYCIRLAFRLVFWLL